MLESIWRGYLRAEGDGARLGRALGVPPWCPARSGVQVNGWIWTHEFGAITVEAVTA